MAAMAPFGGGMGSSGQVCGCLSGALAVIGFTLGKTKAKEHDHKMMWKGSHQTVIRFAEITQEYGGTHCSDIAKVDWRDRQSVKKFYKDPEGCRKNCFHVIRETSYFLCTLVEEYFPQED